MTMYDVIGGSTEIIGQAAADPDMRALMSNDPTFIGAQFQGRIPEMRIAMSRLAQLANAMNRVPVSRAMDGFALASSLPSRVSEQLQVALASNTPIAVKEREITEAYECPFGFTSLAVPAGALVNILLQPAATFKPNRLSIPQAVAPSFQLTAFLIGQTSLILNGNAVPAEAFSDLSYNPRGWKLPTIQVGQPATMTWQNISGAPADLRGLFWGVFVA